MKNLAFAFLALVAFLPLRADEYIRNGDFQHGSANWDGDGRSTTAQSDPDSAGMADTSAGTPGMIIKFRKGNWTKVSQEFDSRGSTLTIKVTLSFSSDTAFSTKADDYLNVTSAIEFNAWESFDLNPGTYMVMLTDVSAPRGHTGSFHIYHPQLNSTDPYIVTFTVENFVSDSSSRKTFTMAFPPAEGSVTITHVSVESPSNQ